MNSSKSILLLQTPFASHNSAPLGLARIKSALTSEGYRCDVRYLDHELEADIGEEISGCLALRAAYWLIELLYATELFPDHIDKDTFLKRCQALTSNNPRLFDFPSPLNLLDTIHRFNQGILNSWRERFPYDAVGIGCNFYLMSPLFFASSIKKLHPRVQVILGGMQCSGEVGNALIATFPFLDWVVKGEGEITAVKIMNLIGKRVKDIPAGACYRNGSRILCKPEEAKPVDLEQLPFPDFDDFVSSYKRHAFRSPINLSMEIGRGCWWRKCAFCGFNSLGKNYRRISDRRFVETIEHLAERHNILNFQFVDNIAPPHIEELAKAIAASPHDFKWMISLRANTPPAVIQLLAKAGAKHLFFGIESFSTSVLTRMKKGTTLLDNILSLKEAHRVGIHTPYFLLTQFPGETKTEVRRTKEINNLIPHLNMLSMESPFYINYGCPTQQDPHRYGLKRVSPSPHYKWLLPKEYRFSPTYLWDYSPKSRRQAVIEPRRQPLLHEAKLEILDRGPTSSVVVDTRWASREYAISKKERDVVIACDTPKSLEELGCSENMLRLLMKKKLIIEDCEKYISLAIIRS